MSASERISERGPRLGFLDFIRAAAILHIFIFHFFIFNAPTDITDTIDIIPLLTKEMYSFVETGGLNVLNTIDSLFLLVHSIGGQAVSVFFIVSGFALTWSQLSLGREEISYGSFLKRRFSKIIIPYWIALAFMTWMNNAWMKDTFIWDIATHVLCIHNFFQAYEGSIEASYWFIGAIVHFYLLFPILYRWLITNKHQGRILLIVLLSMFYRAVIPLDPFGLISTFRLNEIFIFYLDVFVIGMVLARWYYNNPEGAARILKQTWILIPLLVVYALTISRYSHKDFPLYVPLVGSTLFVLFYQLSFIVSGSVRRFMLSFSGVSYTFYLIHMTPAIVVKNYIVWLYPLPWYVIEIIAAVILIALSFRIGPSFKRMNMWLPEEYRVENQCIRFQKDILIFIGTFQGSGGSKSGSKSDEAVLSHSLYVIGIVGILIVYAFLAPSYGDLGLPYITVLAAALLSRRDLLFPLLIAVMLIALASDNVIPAIMPSWPIGYAEPTFDEKHEIHETMREFTNRTEPKTTLIVSARQGAYDLQICTGRRLFRMLPTHTGPYTDWPALERVVDTIYASNDSAIVESLLREYNITHVAFEGWTESVYGEKKVGLSGLAREKKLVPANFTNCGYTLYAFRRDV